MRIFDTHAHYDDEAFDKDRKELIESFKENNVEYIVNVAANLKSIEQILILIKTIEFIYGTVGVHPDDTKELTNENFNWMKEIAKEEEKIVAIGEIGLDYYWNNSEKDVQKYWFEKQMDMAGELKLPVIIHSREAAKDTLDMVKGLDGADRKIDIHCFSYSVDMAREYLNMGHYLGIGGVVTFKNSRKLKEVVEYMPLENILLETDAPYLAPVPFRGKRNDSRKIALVIAEIARIRGISEELVAEQAFKNASRFYFDQEDLV